MHKVQCPRCGKPQNYLPRPGPLRGKRKACVYCNFSIDVVKHLR